MSNQTIKIGFNTLGDLLDELTKLGTDLNLSGVLDSTVYGPNGEEFTEFAIETAVLSDNSEVLDFYLHETGENDEPSHDDTVLFCPDCENPNQFGELCPDCKRGAEERGEI